MMMRLSLAAASCLVTLGQAAAVVTHREQCGQWPGWDKVSNLFTFGDSYTSTAFQISGKQPSPGNPMGNPPYPGGTSAAGPNWVGYLTTKYNDTLVLSYNIAFGGATVDAQLAKPYLPTVHSLIDQVESDWLPTYGNPRFQNGALRNRWKSHNSLFGIWMGVNDVMNTHASDNATLVPTIFNKYYELVEKLYQAGARNFLFLDAPALQNAPIQQKWAQALPHLATAVKRWADGLQSLADKLRRAHPDAITITFSTSRVFENILLDPTTYQATAGLKILKPEYCEAYSNGWKQGSSKAPSCKAAVSEYFWLNNVHPTYPVHEAVASELSKTLRQLKPSVLCSPVV